MKSINPYLLFAGKAEEAFHFYKSIFGGEIINLQKYKDSSEPDYIRPDDLDKIMHIYLKIRDDIFLMGSDSLEPVGHEITFGNNVYINFNMETEEEAYNIFNKLSQDGIVQMQIQKTFWGALFGMVKDKYGMNWMINYQFHHQQE
jgi:PhnB protein